MSIDDNKSFSEDQNQEKLHFSPHGVNAAFIDARYRRWLLTGVVNSWVQMTGLGGGGQINEQMTGSPNKEDRTFTPDISSLLFPNVKAKSMSTEMFATTNSVCQTYRKDSQLST